MRRLLCWTLVPAYLLTIGLTGCSGNKGIDLRTDSTVPFVAGKDPEPIIAGGGGAGGSAKNEKKPQQKWTGGTAAAPAAPAPATPPK
jgi:hypothetical protein